MATQTDLDRDTDTLAIVADHVRILQLRLHEASAQAQTDEAIDAISYLSNGLEDLTSDFRAVLARLTTEANRANDRFDVRHQRSLRAAE